MAVDMFLELKGIDGETQDDSFSKKKAIDVLAWSWGMSQSGSFHTGGGGGAGKVNIQDISVTKWVDLSSPLLMLYTSNGDHIPEGTLTVRKAGKTPLEYIVIKMEKIMVTSVSTGGSGGEDRLTENITLNFARCEMKYVEQKDTGAKGTVKEYKWDIAANKQV
jgi:type VI secretion system secreted protein Hcp